MAEFVYFRGGDAAKNEVLDGLRGWDWRKGGAPVIEIGRAHV